MEDYRFQDVMPNPAKALMLAKREVPVLVYDAVQLEGINLTLPEIQTLLDGVTVGGHKLSDQQIAVNQSEAWKKLFTDIEHDRFIVSANYVQDLHAIAAKEEALEWGKFRSGGVTIAGTSYTPPSADGLQAKFEEMVKDSASITGIYDKAIFTFLTMARCQFFYDVNKRMGRFMMNGILLSQGYPVINVPAKRKLEFNELMLKFYESDDQGPMNHFLRSCIDERTINIMLEH